MDRLEGIKLSQAEQLVAEGCDREMLARRGAELYMQMIFQDGFYHADPHPGNVLVLAGDKIGLLDFGMVGRIDERLREDMEDLLVAVVNRDPVQLASLIERIGQVPAGLDDAALQADLADYVAHFGAQPLDRLVLADALEEMIDIIHRYHIRLPPQVAMLLKVFITLEGTARLLCPTFSLLQVIQQHQRSAGAPPLVAGPTAAEAAADLRRSGTSGGGLAAPHRGHHGADPGGGDSMSIWITAAWNPRSIAWCWACWPARLYMGSALMLSRKVPPLLFQSPTIFGLHEVSVLGVGGIAVAVLLGLRLLRAIGKSGHLDRRG